MKKADLKKLLPTSWLCDDCGTEVGDRRARPQVIMARADGYTLSTINFIRAAVWAEAGGQPDGWLCDDCLEKRLGRRLRPEDYEPKEWLEDHWLYRRVKN